MKISELLTDEVNQLTDGFSKSQSVNYLYKLCKRIVEIKIYRSLRFNWLNLIKSAVYKANTNVLRKLFTVLTLL